METVHSGSQFEGAQSIMGREGMAAGVRGGWLHCVHSQEVEGEITGAQITFSFAFIKDQSPPDGTPSIQGVSSHLN